MKTRKSTELKVEAEFVEDGVWFRWGKLTVHLSARGDVSDDAKYIRIFVTSADEVSTDHNDISIPVTDDGLALEVR